MGLACPTVGRSCPTSVPESAVAVVIEWSATSSGGLGFALSTWTPWELLGAPSSRPPSLICCFWAARQRAYIVFHSAPPRRNRAHLPGSGQHPAPGPQTPRPPWSPMSSRLLLCPAPQPLARLPLLLQSAGSGTAEPDAGPFVRRAAIRVPGGRSDRLWCPSLLGRPAGHPASPPTWQCGRHAGTPSRYPRAPSPQSGQSPVQAGAPTRAQRRDWGRSPPHPAPPRQAENPRWRSLWENSDFPERNRRSPGGGLPVLDGKFLSSGGWGLRRA